MNGVGSNRRIPMMKSIVVKLVAVEEQGDVRRRKADTKLHGDIELDFKAGLNTK